MPTQLPGVRTALPASPSGASLLLLGALALVLPLLGGCGRGKVFAIEGTPIPQPTPDRTVEAVIRCAAGSPVVLGAMTTPSVGPSSRSVTTPGTRAPTIPPTRSVSPGSATSAPTASTSVAKAAVTPTARTPAPTVTQTVAAVATARPAATAAPSATSVAAVVSVLTPAAATPGPSATATPRQAQAPTASPTGRIAAPCSAPTPRTR